MSRRQAAKQLAAIGVDTEVVAVDVGRAGGPEAAARSARYAVLEAQDADAVLLAHTLDDQAETVLLGLGRGSGPRSIAGMAAGQRHLPPAVPRAASQPTPSRSVGRRASTWWVDPHNSDPAYRRVRIRSEADAAARGRARRRCGRGARAYGRPGAGRRRLPRRPRRMRSPIRSTSPRSRALAPALRSRVLRRTALAAGADPSALTAAHLAEIDRLVTDWHGQLRIELPGGVACVRVGDCLAYVTTPVGG